MAEPHPTLEQVLGRARRSRRYGFDLPLVEDPDAAAAVAREIAAKLASLPPSDRPLLISDVELLQSVLAGRLSTLRRAMSASSAEVIALVQGMGARKAYMGGQALLRRNGRGEDRR